MRLAVLWSNLSGYMSTCLKLFAERYDADLLVIVQPGKETAPFASKEFEWIKNYVVYQDATNFPFFQRQVREFEPDSILMCSWNFRDYMRLTRSEPFKQLPRISGTDNQWVGTLKQYVGMIVSPVFLKPSIDCFFVPGDRQADFCLRLGYDRDRIVTGFYSCDTSRFSAVHHAKDKASLPHAFLFVGRMVPEKGVRDLIDAYKFYRKSVADPYPLICVGIGPLLDLVRSIEGIEANGFIQPSQLPKFFVRADCLLLPSLYEPWGVVLHEATTAGLAVICTRSCGASVHLVQENYNGYVVRPGKPKDLAAAMIDYSTMADRDKEVMSKNSHVLSQQFTSERWARTLYKAIERVRDQKQYVPDG